jgi:transcriptional regulator with XRE-family HTH domain
MPRRSHRSRTAARLSGRDSARAAAFRLGSQIKAARKRRHWNQGDLGDKLGLSGARVGQIERGAGVGASLEVWFAFAAAVDIPLFVELRRDRLEEVIDAGHLSIQELVLRFGRQVGAIRSFELPTRPQNPSLSVDVHLRDDARRLLVINECWNVFGDVNASVRSTRRKIAEAEELAVAAGGDRGPYRVAACWIVRDTRRNREILARYPEVFASTFTGSSRQWVQALTRPGSMPPEGIGLIWCDVRATRLSAWRRG